MYKRQALNLNPPDLETVQAILPLLEKEQLLSLIHIWGQTYHAVKAAAQIQGPVYIRAGSGREKEVYEKDVPFTMEGIRVLRKYGTDVLLLSSGFVLDRVLKAADLLREKGIYATVGDINIINAKNPEKVIEEIKRVKRIVTVEDHNIHGGLGAYISKPPPQSLRIDIHLHDCIVFRHKRSIREIRLRFLMAYIGNTIREREQEAQTEPPRPKAPAAK